MANGSEKHKANGEAVATNIAQEVASEVVQALREDGKPNKIGLNGSALREQILDNARHLYRISFPDAIPEMRLVIEKSDLRPYMASVWYDRGALMQAPGLVIVCGYPGANTVAEALEDVLEKSIKEIAKKTVQNQADGR